MNWVGASKLIDQNITQYEYKGEYKCEYNMITMISVGVQKTEITIKKQLCEHCYYYYNISKQSSNLVSSSLTWKQKKSLLTINDKFYYVLLNINI